MQQMVHQAIKRQWISGLAIILTTLVCLFGFWRLSPSTTLLVSLVSLVGLIFVFWLAGKRN
jgi:arginine exporter protein ArgO